MKRRRFILGASSSLLLPFHIVFAASRPGLPHADYLFYDDRFEAAGKLALEWAGTAEVIPVRSDVTDIWRAGLSRVRHRGPLLLRGVTTESFHFCLKTVLEDSSGINSQISRINRDLYLWTIRSESTTHKGMSS